jgi:hypothetical protein
MKGKSHLFGLFVWMAFAIYSGTNSLPLWLTIAGAFLSGYAASIFLTKATE